MVPKNQQQQSELYYTSAYYRDDLQCTSAFQKQFYLVTSFYDQTHINVTQQDGFTIDVELPNFGTYVQMTTSSFDQLASGTNIISSKPINVISGNLCVRNSVDEPTGYYGTYISSIPGVLSLGTEYVVPRIISDDGDAPGYSVSVVATEDDTAVESDGEVVTLDEGETAIFEYDLKDNSTIVKCSRNCLVVQYTKPSFADHGMFMQSVLPQQDFSTAAYFTTGVAVYTSFLSLVVEGESPGDDIYLNGESLGDLTWTEANGYTTAEMTLPQAPYRLDSSNGRPFAAYVYLHQDDGDETGLGMIYIYHSKEIMFFSSICLFAFLFVCLSISRIMQKVVNGLR